MAATKKPFSVEALWQIERLGTPSLSPDGASAVCALTRPDLAANKSTTTLWRFDCRNGSAPRELTHCGDKDGQPRWSPRGDQIAFVAKREQQGVKDDEAQLYLIAVDGGEARRVKSVATGVEGFRWFGDGKRIAFVSWVWPGVKGQAAQAKKLAEFKARKTSGYATSEAQYRFWDHSIPAGRVAHLYVVDVVSGKLTDLFEATPFELSRADPNANCFDVSPDGRHIVFAFDPAAQKQVGNRFALAEIDLLSGRITTLVHDPAWDLGAPRYSEGGAHIAFTAAHRSVKHTMPDQLAIWHRDSGSWEVVSAEWDHEVRPPLLWEDDAMAVLFSAEEKGRCHLWRFDLADRRAEIAVAGGTLHGFDKCAGTLVTLADAADHPSRLHAQRPGASPLRLEAFNDGLLAGIELGRHEELWFSGAAAMPDGVGDPVQMWVFYPPGFDGKTRKPLLHLIHGGPHTAFGDAWHERWNVHAFAAQGYVVACVNYHGSSGFGYAFLDSISHRWGALELQDIEAATDALLKKRWADRRRVFASGGSYGGFMVAWMNGHVAPGRYAAYVCHAGCFDWTAMFADDAYTWHAQELGAWYWDDPARIAAQSPHASAAAMKTPTLVSHGALDYRVPDQQGLAYYNTLKARGVPARLLWFPDENHWILKPRNSQQWHEEFFAWLKSHDIGAAVQKSSAKSVAAPAQVKSEKTADNKLAVKTTRPRTPAKTRR
jgi:dipeptidyl aminopeptidase/acylaminoacyl peptidase